MGAPHTAASGRHSSPKRRTGSACSPFRFEPAICNCKLDAIECRGIGGLSCHCRQLRLLKLSPIPDSQAASDRRFDKAYPAGHDGPVFAFPRSPPGWGGSSPPAGQRRGAAAMAAGTAASHRQATQTPWADGYEGRAHALTNMFLNRCLNIQGRESRLSNHFN